MTQRAHDITVAALHERLAGFPAPVAAALAEGIAARARGRPGHDPERPPLAVLDWDNTCAWNDIGEAVFDRMAARADFALEGAALLALVPESLEGIPWRERVAALLPRARAGDAAARASLRAHLSVLYDAVQGTTSESKAEAYRWVASLLAGRTAAALEAYAAETIAEGLAEPLASETLSVPGVPGPVTVFRGLRIFAPMRALAGALLDAGWEARVVSASCEPLVRAFAPRLGLAPEAVVGVRLAEEAPGGLLLPRVAPPFPYAEGKLLAIDARIGRRPALVAGDSAGDLPMLRAASDLRLVVARFPPTRGALEEARRAPFERGVAREVASPGGEAHRIAAAEGWPYVSSVELLAASGERLGD